MIPKIKKTKTSSGDYRFDYICKLKYESRGVKCKCKNSNGNEADKAVLEVIKVELANKKSKFYKHIKSLASGKDLENCEFKESIKSLERQYNSNRNAINNLLENLKYVDSSLVQDISEQLVELKQKNITIEEELKELNKQSPNIIASQDVAKKILYALDNYFPRRFSKLDLNSKRNLIRLFIAQVEVDSEDIIIDLIGAKHKIKKSVLPCDNSKRNTNAL